MEEKKMLFRPINLKSDKIQTQVYQLLKKEIARGAFPDGKLPSEPKLAEALGVSRATISATLSSLQRDGIIIRKHGSATYVNKQFASIKASITEGVSIYEIISNCGYSPSLKWSKRCILSQPDIPKNISKKLELSDKDQIIRFERLFCADGNPAAYVEEYIPCKNLKGEIPEDEKLPSTLYEMAEEYCTSPIEFTVVDVVPCVPEDSVSNLFEKGTGRGILLVEELHLNNCSEPIVFSKVNTFDKYIRFQAMRIKR